ncbi:hypothetical protein EAG_01213, partial [Camponotus floridanus]
SETVTADHYQQQFYRLNDELMRKRPVILLHDNAQPCCKNGKRTIGTAKQSPAPASILHTWSDYYLFRSMQHALADTYFSNYEQVQKCIDQWIASKNKSFYRRGIQFL